MAHAAGETSDARAVAERDEEGALETAAAPRVPRSRAQMTAAALLALGSVAIIGWTVVSLASKPADDPRAADASPATVRRSPGCGPTSRSAASGSGHRPVRGERRSRSVGHQACSRRPSPRPQDRRSQPWRRPGLARASAAGAGPAWTRGIARHRTRPRSRRCRRDGARRASGRRAARRGARSRRACRGRTARYGRQWTLIPSGAARARPPRLAKLTTGTRPRAGQVCRARPPGRLASACGIRVARQPYKRGGTR